MRYTIAIERGKHNFSAYAPDVLGCVATGATLEEVKQQMSEALEFHFEGLLEDLESIPEPTTFYDYVDVKVPAQK